MATDAEIRAAGLYAVPKNKYLQNEFQLPTEEVEEETSGGITNTNAFTNSGGNNFSVYNPDPNSIVNKNYDPRPNYDAYYEDTFGTNLGDPEALTATGAKFYEPPPSKMQGLLSMIPYAGAFTKGMKFLGDEIGPYLPTNKRSILENQLGGQGVMVNDIGQIVQGAGAYDTAANVMAGYNANQMTTETFDKRLNKITKNKSYNQLSKGLQKRFDAITEAKKIFENQTKKTDKIFDFEEEEKKKKKKDTIVGRYITKKKEKKVAADAKDAADAQSAAAVTMQRNTFVPPSGVTGGDNKTDYVGRSNQYGTHDATKTREEAATNRESYRGKDGGRAGYFFGGRARLQGGGMSQGNESNISQSTNMGGGITGDLSTPEQTANHNRAMRDNQREKPSTIKNIIDTGSELSYLNNLKNLNVPGIALNFGVNKFRNFLDNRKTKEEDKLSYNTNSLPTNNYFAEVKQKDLNASKMKGFKQQDYPSYKDQMEMLGGTTVSPYEFKGLQDGTITTTGTFTAANGGRAMFKNGGLASIL